MLNDSQVLTSLSLQFQKNTEHSNFSNSVVDVFTQLTQCFEVLQKLECQDPEIWKCYMNRFAKTVVKVLTSYADLLKQDFPNHVRDESTVRGTSLFHIMQPCPLERAERRPESVLGALTARPASYRGTSPATLLAVGSAVSGLALRVNRICRQIPAKSRQRIPRVTRA